MLSRQAGCSAFQDFPHGIEFKHFSRVETSNDEAPAASGLHEPPCHEPPKSFSYWCSADLETLSHFFLTEPISWAVKTGTQCLAERTKDRFAERNASIPVYQFQSVRPSIRHPRSRC